MVRLIFVTLLALMILSSQPTSVNAEEKQPLASPVPSPVAEQDKDNLPSADLLPKKSEPAKPGEILPPIMAKTYSVIIQKKAMSDRVYLFKDKEKADPKVGKVILLKRSSKPVMAFRVLKSYLPESNQFAAKKVRVYPPYKSLQLNDSFEAIEKVADLFPSQKPPAPTIQDKKDLKELENLNASPTPESSPQPEASPKLENQTEKPLSTPQLNDPELDKEFETSAPATKTQLTQADPDEDKSPSKFSPGGPSAKPKEPNQEEPEEDRLQDYEEDDLNELIIHEAFPVDQNNHGISGAFGWVRNQTFDGKDTYLLSMGARYGLTLGKTILLKSAQLQDSFVIEGGVFAYTINGEDVETTTDAKGNKNTEQFAYSYKLLGLTGSVRYNLLFGENLGVFLYAGLLKNGVIDSNDREHLINDRLQALSLASIGAGLGLLYRIGPNWDFRIDVGLDQATTGLMIRF